MGKVYDLELRSEQFAQKCRELVRLIPIDLANKEDARQLVRSSGSVAANYVEANEGFSRKDFSYRIKVSRKESKESRLWLKLLYISDAELDKRRRLLVIEATEFVKIFNAILMKQERDES